MKLESRVIAKTYKIDGCFCFLMALLTFRYYSMQFLGSLLLCGRCPASGMLASSGALGNQNGDGVSEVSEQGVLRGVRPKSCGLNGTLRLRPSRPCVRCMY